MAIWQKADSTKDIINGLAAVNSGVKTKTYDPSPEAGPSGLVRSQHVASGDSLQMYQTLNGRYKTGPSGWSG